jgi:hypothetical protein
MAFCLITYSLPLNVVLLNAFIPCVFSDKCLYSVCCSSKCHSSVCCSAKCPSSACCSAKCHSTECRVTIISTMTNLNRSKTAMKFEKKCLLRKIINSPTTFYLLSQSPSASLQNSSKKLSCMGAKLSPTHPDKTSPFPFNLVACIMKPFTAAINSELK